MHMTETDTFEKKIEFQFKNKEKKRKKKHNNKQSGWKTWRKVNLIEI